MQGIFDSHAHYNDERFAEDRESLLPQIHCNGVSHILNAGCDIPSSMDGIRLAEQFPYIYASVGIHPEEVDHIPENYLDTLAQLAKHPKVVAVGEIGLDYHYENANTAIQQKVFCQQLDLADQLSLPVIIHSRDATQDTINILNSRRNHRGVLHCFSGSADTAQIYLKMGYYIGFTGVVTFSNAKKAIEAAKVIPLDRILLETDCPYMAPVPFRGKRCTSDMIAHTAAKIAEIKGIPPQQMVDIARENTCRLFGIK